MRADYYQLLDAEPGASAAELKAAYYRLAKRYHPDLNAGNPAAEERFKLVAEAYRVLGVPERRLEYDEWLRVQQLYRRAPELAAFSASPSAAGDAPRVRPFRYSARRAQERQERRYGRAEGRSRSRRRAGSLVFTRSGKVNTWLFIGFYALIIFNLLPIFFRHMWADSPAPARRGAAPAAEAKVDEATARQRVLEMEHALRRRAEAGEAVAQYRLGLYLFNKSCRGRGEAEAPTLLRRAANAAYRAEALEWLSRAAAQGHAGAGRLLKCLHPAPAAVQQPSSSL